MEARESQRDLMQQACTEAAFPEDGIPAKPSTPSTSELSVCFEEEEKKPFLDLAIREILQNRSTATSLASLACPDKHVPQDEDNIKPVDKESQLKAQTRNFKSAYVYPYPCKPPKKKRL